MHQGHPVTVREWFQEKHAKDFPGFRLMKQGDLRRDSLWDMIRGWRKVHVVILHSTSEVLPHHSRCYPYRVTRHITIREVTGIQPISDAAWAPSPDEFLGNTPWIPGQRSVKVYLAKNWRRGGPSIDAGSARTKFLRYLHYTF